MESSRKSTGDLNISSSYELNSSTNYEKNMVETFLDENTDFLEDYVRRKVLSTKMLSTNNEKVHFIKNKIKFRASETLNESYFKYLDKKVTFCKLLFSKSGYF